MIERLTIDQNIKTEQLAILTTEEIKELSTALNAMFVRLQKKLFIIYGPNSDKVKSLSSMLNALLEKNIETVKDLELQYKLVKSLMALELGEKIESFEFFVKYFSSKSNKENNKFLDAYVKKHQSPIDSRDMEVKNVSDDFQIKAEKKVLLKDDAVFLSPVPAEMALKNEQLEYENQLVALREDLLKKQTQLAHFGTLKTLFKKKEKLALEAAIKADQEKIEKLRQEKVITGIHAFCVDRSMALEQMVKYNEEEKQKKYAKKLYAFYEKYFMKKLLPEGMRKKLEKQGFLGRFLANSCTMNATLSFALLGGGLAIGGASVVGASILSGRRILSGASSGVGSYNLMKLGNDAWAKSHGWDKELSDQELNKLSIKNLITYLAHYEANALLNGKTVNGDEYYTKLTKYLKNKLKLTQTEKHLDDQVWEKYLLKMEKTLDKKFQEALNKKVKQKSRLKYYATAIGVFVGSGMMQKVLGHLFGDKGTNAPVASEQSSATLLTEQAIHQSTDLPPLLENMDLSAENTVDYTLIPELAEQHDQAGDLLIAKPNLTSAEEILTPLTKRTAEMLKESFFYNHPLIENVGGVAEIIDGKTQVIFNLGIDGDFELKQQALRRVMMDVFPIQELVDKDGLSVLDIGRIESNVATFTKLLEGDSFHGFSPDILKDVMHLDGQQLIITDYEKLTKISEQVLQESKQWVPNVSSGFVRVGQNTDNSIWEAMLKMKMANIKI